MLADTREGDGTQSTPCLTVCVRACCAPFPSPPSDARILGGVPCEGTLELIQEVTDVCLCVCVRVCARRAPWCWCVV
jgi:hypothetical protein